MVIRWGSKGKVLLPREGDDEGEENEEEEGTVKLTPVHRLRQLEPSLFFKGQMTSLLASVTENELVSELRGGMVHMCSLPLSMNLSVSHSLLLSFVVVVLVCGGGSAGVYGEQDDPGEVDIYVEAKGYEHNRGSQRGEMQK